MGIGYSLVLATEVWIRDKRNRRLSDVKYKGDDSSERNFSTVNPIGFYRRVLSATRTYDSSGNEIGAEERQKIISILDALDPQTEERLNQGMRLSAVERAQFRSRWDLQEEAMRRLLKDIYYYHHVVTELRQTGAEGAPSSAEALLDDDDLLEWEENFTWEV
jgi:hypothetical protein